MKAYTYIKKGEFALVDKQKPPDFVTQKIRIL